MKLGNYLKGKLKAKMYRYFITFLLCLYSASFLSGQGGINPTEGSKSLAMGGTGLNNTDAYSTLLNPAGMVNIKNISAIVDVQQRFELSDLRGVAMGIGKNTKLGTFGLILNSYGNDLYTEQKIGIAYARPLSELLSISGQVNALLFNIDNFGSATRFSVDFGMQSKLNDELFFSAHISNPIGIELTEGSDLLTRFRFGLLYQPSDKIECHLEADKLVDQVLGVRFGVQYQLIEKLFVRAGYATQPATFSSGLSYALNPSLKVEGAFSMHQQLGLSPGISIVWSKL